MVFWYKNTDHDIARKSLRYWQKHAECATLVKEFEAKDIEQLRV